MTVTEIADEVQSQLLSLVQIAQENVVDAIERVSERAQDLLPASATALREPPPQRRDARRPELRDHRAVAAVAATVRRQAGRCADAAV